MKVENMLGYKIFKENKDDVIIYRIIKIKQYKDGGSPATITVKDLFTDEIKVVRVDELKDFTPLIPDGYMTFSCVVVHDSKGNPVEDVVVTASKILNLKIGDITPYAICRQNITDIFYNYLCKSENDMIVGLAVNQDDSPSNFDFREFLACDSIVRSQSINFYRTDTLFDDILPIIKVGKLNEVLEKNYMKHVKATGDSKLAFKKEDKGWCKDIETLLKENNFQYDIDQMLGIKAVNFKLEDEIVKKKLPGLDEEYDSINDNLKMWLSNLDKVNINTISIIKYGYDINLADFNNSNYFLIRDNTKQLYLLVYTIDNTELEIDLINKMNEPDFTTKYCLEFYNKYYKYNNDN